MPSIADDLQAWVVMRARVSDYSTVFAGTSRAQADLDPRVWADEVGGPLPVNLSIAGGSVLPVLLDLASDESFRGTVLVDFLPRVEFDATRHREELAEPYVKAYHDVRRSPARYAEAYLRYVMPGMVIRNPGLSPGRVLGTALTALRTGGVAEGFLPVPPYFAIRSDRYMSLDFSRVDVAERTAVLIQQISERGRPGTDAEVDEALNRLAHPVRQIEQRGGRVILVHFPHCGAIAELEEREYPRALYWSRLEARGIGETLHVDDYPPLSRFDCPDGSHLDTRDSASFTRALLSILVERGASGVTRAGSLRE